MVACEAMRDTYPNRFVDCDYFAQLVPSLTMTRRVHALSTSAVPAAVLAFLFPLLVPSVASAEDIHVDARHPGKESGTASAPYRTVGAAVKAASAGDRVLVAAGTYSESLHIKKSLTIEGGFVGASRDAYQSGQEGDFTASDPKTRESILRGGSNAPVVFADGTIETTIIGLVITGGKMGIEAAGYPEAKARLVVRHSRIENNGSPSVIGGGIRARAELLVEDSVVRGNTGDRGSGIASGPARAVVSRSLIDGNTSHGDHGGGIYAAGVIDVYGCVIRNNTVGKAVGYGWGGGMIFFNVGTRATVVDTEIRGNSAPTKGSGVFVDDGAEATLRNVIIANNQCAKEGGALYVDGDDQGRGSKVSLVNVTIAGHDCPDNGYGHAIVMERQSTLDIVSSIIWNRSKLEATVSSGNKLTARYSNSRNKFDGVGNISEDPKFVAPDKGDYRLKNANGRWDSASETCAKDKVTSPCVDKGDPAGAFDREPEPNSNRVDMGAYGNSPMAGCGTQESLAEVASSVGTTPNTMFGGTAPSLGPSTAGAGTGRCGCAVPGSGGPPGSAMWLSLLGIAVVVSRRCLRFGKRVRASTCPGNAQVNTRL